jgi:hypothetical protein
MQDDRLSREKMGLVHGFYNIHNMSAIYFQVMQEGRHA